MWYTLLAPALISLWKANTIISWNQIFLKTGIWHQVRWKIFLKKTLRRHIYSKIFISSSWHLVTLLDIHRQPSHQISTFHSIKFLSMINNNINAKFFPVIIDSDNLTSLNFTMIYYQIGFYPKVTPSKQLDLLDATDYSAHGEYEDQQDSDHNPCYLLRLQLWNNRYILQIWLFLTLLFILQQTTPHMASMKTNKTPTTMPATSSDCNSETTGIYYKYT